MQRVTTSFRFSNTVDLKKYPEKIDFSKSPKHFTIGDLHGNALKLIHFLVKINVLNINESDYTKLCDLYHSIEKGNMQAISEFRSIIQKQSLTSMAKDIKIRLLGDLLADRGANDYLTLLVLSLLKNTKYEILISNHDLEYLTHSENNKLADMKSGYFLGTSYIASIIHLKEFLNAQTDIKVDDIKSLENLHYKPHLKLFSYSLPEKSDAIHIYSHAVIDLLTIERAAIAFGIDTTKIKKSRDELRIVLDKINACFKTYVEKSKTHTLFDLIQSGAGSVGRISHSFPFVQAVWNRTLFEREVKIYNNTSYPIEFYHGHTPATHLPHYHGYDNILGKGPGASEGDMEIYRSDNRTSSWYKPESKPVCFSPIQQIMADLLDSDDKIIQNKGPR